MIQLRPYQQEACQAVLDYWAAGGGNPLVSLATGLGKSLLIAKLTQDILAEYRDMRVLALVHVRELVEQNVKALLSVWPDAPVGINSAGLGRRDRHHRILFSSIQSVYRDAASLGQRDLVLIDEAHLVPKSGDGMYRTLLEKLRDRAPDMRVAGFTATPFRLDAGRLDHGEGRLFDETVYDYGIGQGIADGWLSPLLSKGSVTEIDVSGVKRAGGEFVAGALEAAADKESLTRAAVAEVLRYGADRRSWLVFCSGVKHAANVRDALRAVGVNAETITGETPAGERARLIRDFKAGHIRALTNAQVLTTGFDAPMVDLIVFLRPTLSTGLYLQMVGRGTRLANGKDNCLVLDFAGNVRRHGPVDAVVTPGDRSGGGKGAATVDSVRAKECPGCQSLVAVQARTCPWCGHLWEAAPKAKHEAEADTTPILTSEKREPELIPVVSWRSDRHVKEGGTDSLRVTYFAGLQSYQEWVCLQHRGPMRERAEYWWHRHDGGAAPATIDEALQRFDRLTMPAQIMVRREGKFWRIVNRRFAGKQEERAA